MTETEDSPAPAPRRVAPRLAFAAAVLVVAAAAGIWLIFAWVDGERERAMRSWQDRLGIVAESRVAAIAAWLEDQRTVVESLGSDQTVRLYFADIGASGRGGATVSDDALAQAQYLENLLLVTAARTGFTAEPSGPDVRANVERIGRAGLALLDSDLRAVVDTPGLPPRTPALRAFLVSRAEASDPAQFGPYAGPAGGEATMAFAAPLLGFQDETPVGLVVGIRPVADSLFPLMRQPGATEASAEAMLLEIDDAAVRYLSPLAGQAPAGGTLSIDTPSLAAAFAVRNPGGFAERRDYRDVPVLVAARAVPGTDWVLAYKIDRDEALGETDRRLTRLLAILLLAVALTAAALVAAWRHGVSRRAEDAAERFRDIAARFEQQAAFIRRLTDAQPNAVFIVDRNERVTFANDRLARLVGAGRPEDLTAKSLTAVLGPAAAGRYARMVRGAFADETNLMRVERISGEGTESGAGSAERVVQTQYVHLPASAYAPAGVLVVEQDISEAIGGRERSERLLQQLSDTLLAIVDRRDPYAADQSARVAEVARAIARDMALEPVLVDTVGKAASLMNIGKILVPRSVLVKNDRLDAQEMEQVRHALAAGVDLLEGVEFDGPVVETLRQTRAHFDGSGDPQGLSGDDILVTARIVAVANAFVGMVSPRAHRPGMDFDAAIDLLLAGANTTWDRGVIAALVNRLDNLGGRHDWSYFSAAPHGIEGAAS